jgi:hypothetical protein
MNDKIKITKERLGNDFMYCLWVWNPEHNCYCTLKHTADINDPDGGWKLEVAYEDKV